MNLAPLENLRGNYASMASDWTVPQRAADYSDEDQAVWRLRVERQLGYKHAKYLTGIEAVASLSGIGEGRGGYWEDRADYQWYAGI